MYCVNSVISLVKREVEFLTLGISYFCLKSRKHLVCQWVTCMSGRSFPPRKPHNHLGGNHFLSITEANSLGLIGSSQQLWTLSCDWLGILLLFDLASDGHLQMSSNDNSRPKSESPVLRSNWTYIPKTVDRWVALMKFDPLSKLVQILIFKLCIFSMVDPSHKTPPP